MKKISALNKVQVSRNHYFNLRYDKKSRWISYWYQINEVLSQKPGKVLEIGVGNKTVSDYLKKQNIDVKTLDMDKDLNPDIIGDVSNIPVKKESFDVVLCAEVLEHLPFSKFNKALNELRRISKRTVILTLPHFSATNLYFGLKLIPFTEKINVSLKIDVPIKHKFTGEHYWEIGKSGYSLSKVKEKIKRSGFKILRSYYPIENPYHHFFVLEKIGKNP